MILWLLALRALKCWKKKRFLWPWNGSIYCGFTNCLITSIFNYFLLSRRKRLYNRLASLSDLIPCFDNELPKRLLQLCNQQACLHHMHWEGQSVECCREHNDKDRTERIRQTRQCFRRHALNWLLWYDAVLEFEMAENSIILSKNFGNALLEHNSWVRQAEFSLKTFSQSHNCTQIGFSPLHWWDNWVQDVY